MIVGPGEPGTAAAMGRGGLRASDADREQAIDTLKAAFVQGWLTRDQLGARAGQALLSRTYAELAAVTDGIPARPAVVAPPALPAGRVRKPVGKKVAAWAACVILPAVLGAAFLTYYGGFFVLFLLAFTGMTLTSNAAGCPRASRWAGADRSHRGPHQARREKTTPTVC